MWVMGCRARYLLLYQRTLAAAVEFFPRPATDAEMAELQVFVFVRVCGGGGCEKIMVHKNRSEKSVILVFFLSCFCARYFSEVNNHTGRCV